MSTVKIECAGYPWCAAEIMASADQPIDAKHPVRIMTRMGGATLQTYATREEAIALGEMLIRVATAGEVMEVAA